MKRKYELPVEEKKDQFFLKFENQSGIRILSSNIGHKNNMKISEGKRPWFN
jgi:hypothetical protein